MASVRELILEELKLSGVKPVTADFFYTCPICGEPRSEECNGFLSACWYGHTWTTHEEGDLIWPCVKKSECVWCIVGRYKSGRDVRPTAFIRRLHPFVAKEREAGLKLRREEEERRRRYQERDRPLIRQALRMGMQTLTTEEASLSYAFCPDCSRLCSGRNDLLVDDTVENACTCFCRWKVHGTSVLVPGTSHFYAFMCPGENQYCPFCDA